MIARALSDRGGRIEARVSGKAHPCVGCLVLNQYTTIGSGAGAFTLAHDDNGNTRVSEGDTFAYDRENRMIASYPAASKTTMAATTLEYDPLGRLWRTSNSIWGVTEYLYDGEHVVAEYDGAIGNLRRRYMWGPGADEPILVDAGGMNCSTTRFLNTDERGTVVALADCYGNRTQVQNYDEYGIPDPANGSIATNGRFGFTGQMWLPEVGVWYYKARMYSPTLGRFMQTDPIGYADGMNWYNYVGGDPVNRSDPSGMLQVISHCTGGYSFDSGGDVFVVAKVCSYSSGNEGGGVGYGANGQENCSVTGRGGVPRCRSLATEVGEGQAPQSVAEEIGDIVVTARRQLAKISNPFSGFNNFVSRALKEIFLPDACCFTAGTLVSTPSGLRAIETLKVGDLVMSRSDKTGETAAKPIVGITPAHERRIWTVTVAYKGEGGRWADERYETTDDHPWRTADNQWVTSATLKHGQVLARENGMAIVTAVVDTKATKLTYNLEIADFHTYFVGKAETWVHNDCLPYGYTYDPRVLTRSRDDPKSHNFPYFLTEEYWDQTMSPCMRMTIAYSRQREL